VVLKVYFKVIVAFVTKYLAHKQKNKKHVGKETTHIVQFLRV